MASDQPQTAGKSRNVLLVVVIVVLIGAAVAFQVQRGGEENVPPVTRDTSDFVVEWQCEKCDYSTRDKAGAGPKPCPECQAETLFPVIEWYCPDHGAVPFFARYDAEGVVVEVKTAEGEWRSPETEEGGWDMACPTCGKKLSPTPIPSSMSPR
jgi:hypothetical protein